MKKLFIVVNHDWFFLSHRQAIGVAAKEAGWDVTIVTCDTGKSEDIRALGLKTINLPINATGMNPVEEMKTFWFLFELYTREKPDVVHHVGLKTILWGGLAAKLTGIKGVVNAVSGLGVMFSGEKQSLVAKGILAVLRFSHSRKGVRVIFQNHEDEDLFLKNHITQQEDSVFIKGSGVDLNEFTYAPDPDTTPLRVMFTARMVREKGVVVLTEAAEMLRKEYEGKVVFLLCGKLSDNPKAMQKEELEALCDGKYIQWLGHRTDVKDLLRQCHIVAFPSYYREGVPKSLIEACATGRPIITTNSIGCKDTVEDGVNGYLIPIKDSQSLAEKLKVLINDKVLREKMGRASRVKAEKEFSLNEVVKKHLECYAELDSEKDLFQQSSK
ncbi:MAG: glycosyltransferase family 4 protein [Prevotella sp.]|nr:glycosyltransferase family 4 protein [Prevotella sp.]